jgi:hypothetical protein
MSEEFDNEFSTLCLWETDIRLWRDYLINFTSSRSPALPPLISSLSALMTARMFCSSTSFLWLEKGLRYPPSYEKNIL